MNKTIKTKESVRNIKTINRRSNLRHYIRKKQISNLRVKDINNNQSTNEINDTNATNNTVGTITNAQKIAAVNTAIQAKKIIINKRNRNNSSKYDTEYNADDKTVIDDNDYHYDNSEYSYADTNTNDAQSYNHKSYIEKKMNKRISKTDYKDVKYIIENTDIEDIKAENNYQSTRIKQKPENFTSTGNSYDETERISLSEIIHRHSINKYQKKLKEQNSNINSSQVSNKSSLSPKNILNNSYTYIKRKVTDGTNLFVYGGGLIILVLITLFIGMFSSLSSDSGTDTSTLNLSEEVLAYTTVIQAYAIEYGIEDYVPLIQAVMMQESGGQGDDPMQSSACGYNKEYPDGITNADYSIDCGVHYLSDCIVKANVESTTDMEHIKLALQGYNFGSGYITWAVTNFGGYTASNAKVYSDQKKSELNTSVYGDVDYVEHVLRYYHLGGNLVEIAITQIGNTGNVYWEWYGFSSRVEWCACFVSWCANESGCLNVTVPKFSGVEEGISWYKNNSRWQDSSYTPNVCDLIFFDWNSDNDPDHVGIVEKIEDGYIYTIEGNSSDEVKERKYQLGYIRIYGYGVVQ